MTTKNEGAHDDQVSNIYDNQVEFMFSVLQHLTVAGQSRLLLILPSLTWGLDEYPTFSMVRSLTVARMAHLW